MTEGGVDAIDRRVVLGGLAAGMALTHRLAGAATPAPMLSPDAMRSDLALLRDAYGRLHPGIYRYATPAQIDARFARLAGDVRRPMSLAAFYLALSRLLASVRCGHTYANFYNQRKAVQAALFKADDRLPLQFLWLGTRMIVTADPYATGIRPGSEITHIDGRPAAAILAALLPLARADGGNDAKRRRLMSMQGEDSFESFDIFFSLLFGKPRYRLDITDPDGRRRQAVVPAVSLTARRARRTAAVDQSAEGPIWTIRRVSGAAILTMPSWALYDSRWDWQGWLNAAVDRLVADRVPRLIVDVRGNEGGMDCGDVLIARLIRAPLLINDANRLIRYRTLPPDLRPHCDTWDRSFDTLGVGAERFDDHFFRLFGSERGATPIEPKGPRYNGQVIVLTSAQNSSATFQFAHAVQRNRLGTLVGDPTGGNRRGINGGCFYFFRLPATGLEADLPLIGEFPPRPEPDAGLIPDRLVPQTPQAIARGEDRALAAALATTA